MKIFRIHTEVTEDIFGHRIVLKRTYIYLLGLKILIATYHNPYGEDD